MVELQLTLFFFLYFWFVRCWPTVVVLLTWRAYCRLSKHESCYRESPVKQTVNANYNHTFYCRDVVRPTLDPRQLHRGLIFHISRWRCPLQNDAYYIFRFMPLALFTELKSKRVNMAADARSLDGPRAAACFFRRQGARHAMSINARVWKDLNDSRQVWHQSLAVVQVRRWSTAPRAT